MTLMTGKNAAIKNATEVIARMISFNLTINNETIDAIYFDSDWTKSVGGIQSWSATIDGFMDIDSTAQVVIKTAAEAHTMLTDLEFYVDATHYYTSDTVSDTEAGCWIESFNVTADNGSLVAFSMSIKGNGPIVYA